MRYASLFDGLGAAHLAAPAGWDCVASSEIDPHALAVLAHHWPSHRQVGDVTAFDWDSVHGSVDLVCGGSPCQSFSIAGKRLGLDDPRGNLALVFLDVVRRSGARWFVYENVPGLLSSDGGRDFGAFLGAVGQLGFGYCYRVLDAQHFGVPQRRRRVFVVGYLGDWRPAAAVLLEPEGMRGDSPPSREAGKGVAGAIASCPDGGSGYRNDADTADNLVATARCLTAGHGMRLDWETETFVTHTLRGDGFDASEDGTGRGTPLVPTAYRTSPNCGAWETGDRTDALTTGSDPTSHVIAFTCKDHGADVGDLSPTLRAMGHDGSHANAGGHVAICIKGAAIGREPHNGPQFGEVLFDGTSYTLNCVDRHAVLPPHHRSAVRRLTPRECERLQGIPDDHTLVPYRGKPMADGPRYKLVGNSWAVPVARWIFSRVDTMDAILRRRVSA
jgi:DNA (cytosine-5)-methyltransferase 1